MKVIDKKITYLKEYEKNPRHNESAVDAVAASIKEFGFKVPIIIDSDGVIIAGHTRLKAAQQLGLKSVPCIVADDLTPDLVKAFRLADNKTAELASWDFSALESELAELNESDLDFDMSDFGFDNDSLELDELEDIELPREERGSSSKVPCIKFGSKTIQMTDEESERLEQFYDKYLKQCGTALGMIYELLDNGDKNYAD